MAQQEALVRGCLWASRTWPIGWCLCSP